MYVLRVLLPCVHASNAARMHYVLPHAPRRREPLKSQPTRLRPACDFVITDQAS
jgi:hypothetical protein|eukprot:COSAG01_NODE_4120_length_5332_cov_18.963310_4_plen_54_part_00